MSYADGGLRFFSRPAPIKFRPKGWIADGIRRMTNDGSMDPGTKFVSDEDYMTLVKASENLAGAMIENAYDRGFIIGVGLMAGIGLTAGFFWYWFFR